MSEKCNPKGSGLRAESQGGAPRSRVVLAAGPVVPTGVPGAFGPAGRTVAARSIHDRTESRAGMSETRAPDHLWVDSPAVLHATFAVDAMRSQLRGC